MTELNINAGSFLGFSANRSAEQAAADVASNRLNICRDRRLFLNGMRVGVSVDELVLLGQMATVSGSEASVSGIDRVADFAFAPHSESLLLFDRGYAGYELVLQVFNGGTVMQYWWTGSSRYFRKLVFADNGRSSLSSNSGWKLDGAAGLAFDAGSRGLSLRDWNGSAVAGSAVTLPLASTSAAGLMSSADKQRLDMAALKSKGGVFDLMELAANGASAVVPQTSSPTQTGGQVVFSDNVKPSASSSLVISAFLYKVGGKYYYSAPSGVSIPSKNGLNVCRMTSGAYYVDGDGQLQLVIPAASDSTPGLISSGAFASIGEPGDRLQVLEEDFLELSGIVSENGRGISGLNEDVAELRNVDNLLTAMVTAADSKTRYLALGSFDSEVDAFAAAAVPEVAGDASYRLLSYGVGNNLYYIEQAVEDSYTMQYLCKGQARKSRYIRFTDANRTAVAEVQQTWQHDLPRNLSYTQSSRVLQMKDMWGKNVGGSVTLPLASASVAGLMSAADKGKLDACVTTDATYSARGLMTAQQASALDGAAQRTAFGVFEGSIIVAEGAAVVPETSSTTSTAGKIVFVSRIGLTPTATVTRGGFLYQVGTKYYMAAPSTYGKPMPMDNGLAISTLDGCAYYVSGNELVKAVPAASLSSSGLMSAADKGKLDGYASVFSGNALATASTAGLMSAADKSALGCLARGLYFHSGLLASADALDALAGQAVYCGDRTVRFFFGRFGAAEETASTVVYVNLHSGNVVTQYRLAGDVVQRRALTFSDSSLGALVSQGDWRSLNPNVWV